MNFESKNKLSNSIILKLTPLINHILHYLLFLDNGNILNPILMSKYLLFFFFISTAIYSQPSDNHFDIDKYPDSNNLVILENDIIINEIMFDPTPRVNLPDAEYVELYNNSENDILMDSWKLFVGKKEYIIPSNTLKAGEYILLVKDVSLFPDLNTVEVKITSLTNSGTVLKLETSTGDLVNQVSYSSDVYSDDGKKDGGWSLELVNPMNICLGLGNWDGSTSKDGGTPGLENSLIDLDYYPEIINFITKVCANDNVDEISISFNSYIYATSLTIDTDYFSSYNYTLHNNPDGGSMLKINLDSNLGDATFFFKLNGLISCDDKHFETDTIWVSSFRDIEKGDVIVNEIMFNPNDESSEFIELFNNSDKFLSLRNVYLSNFSNENDESVKDGEKKVSDVNIIFRPQSYIVVAKDIESIIRIYNCSSRKHFVEVYSLPKLNNDEGNVAVLDPAFSFVDKMVYSSEMHIGMISSEKQKGLSLERIKSDNPSLDFNNWTSASQGSGGATPGLVNSVSPSEFISEGFFEVFPEVFTPNNDGSFDVVELKYNQSEVGVVANVKVFSSNGVFVKEIANNFLLGSEGSFIWNGMNKDNSLCKKGIYIFWVELFDSNGNVTVYKEICVLG